MKRLLAVLSVIALLAACSDSKDSDPPAVLVDFKPTLKVEKLWSYSLEGEKHLRLALRVTVADGVAYAAGYDGQVIALSADKGRKLWSVKTKLPLSAGPGVGEGIVVVGASNGYLVALNAKDGSERWRHRMSSEVLAAPTLAAGLVIVRTVDGRLVALSADNAEQRWIVEQNVPKLSLRGTAPAYVAGDAVIAGFDNGRVVAVELTTGDTQWDTIVGAPRGKNELERLVDIDAPVHVLGDDVFVTGYQGRVAMLGRDTGQIWWARDFSSYRGFTIGDDVLFATSSEGLVVAMRRADGTVDWEQARLRQRGLTAPAVDGDAIVVGDYEGYLHWLNRSNGDLMARTSTDGDRITNAPIVVDGRVFVQTDHGKLIAYKTKPKSKS
jgi:outer membrane protein assembly factor BamB